MTTTLDELISTVEDELNSLITGGQINARHTWFGDIDAPTIQTPAVYFILDSAEQNDMQVIQNSNQIAWNLNYFVYCFHSGLEAQQKFTNARKFTDSVYNLLQTQHASDQRLNNNCQDIGCISIEYGQVSLEVPKTAVMSGGVIKLIVQIIEIF